MQRTGGGGDKHHANKDKKSTFYTQEHMIKTTTSGYTAEWLFFLKVING